VGEFNPLSATGMVARRGGTTITRSARASPFGEARSFLTAAHTVGGHTPDSVRVWLPRRGGAFVAVETIHRHPEADLAVLRVDEGPHDD
jgi:hypothetical protein